MALNTQLRDEASTEDGSAYSLCNLLLLMPYLDLTENGEIDYAATDPAALAQLADVADASLLIVHIGTSAIGRLLAQTAAEPFRDNESADAVEALGWLVAELSELGGVAQRMSAKCRRRTYACMPEVVAPLTLAKP